MAFFFSAVSSRRFSMPLPTELTTLWGSHTRDIQVLKEWLSYRERQVLGRDITKDEAREFTHIVRRIAALLLLEPELDKSNALIKQNCYSWNTTSASTKEVV
jgi:hypothetical protein